MNIGVHFFDLLIWLFGKVEKTVVNLSTPWKMAGVLELETCKIRWFLSVDGNDLPPGFMEKGRTAYRSITIDGEEIDFSEGFTDLHTKVYENVLSGNGFGIEDARASIELVHAIRTSRVVSPGRNDHPLSKRLSGEKQ